MLEVFLRRWKARDEVDPSHQSGQIRTIVDTVYLKLLAQGEKTGELYAMIQAEEETKTNYIVLKEVEHTLVQTGQYNALTMLYRQRGADDRCLDLWAKLAFRLSVCEPQLTFCKDLWKEHTATLTYLSRPPSPELSPSFPHPRTDL